MFLLNAKLNYSQTWLQKLGYNELSVIANTIETLVGY
jgi:hypothetical protein